MPGQALELELVDDEVYLRYRVLRYARCWAYRGTVFETVSYEFRTVSSILHMQFVQDMCPLLIGLRRFDSHMRDR